MIRLAGALAGAAVALAACAPDPQAPAAPQAGKPSAPAPVTAQVAPTRAVGSSLTGQVSGLSADVSALSVRITDTATIVDLPADTLFAFDSAELSPAASGNLLKLADLIRKGAPGAVAIVGHTDSKGDDPYNQALSERRAQAVAGWLQDQAGVRQRAFTVSGRGEAEPVAPNQRPDGSDDPDGRAKNRRVTVTIPR